MVYEKNCSQCHDAENLPLLKQPPTLKKPFQNKTLLSGAPATDEQVRKTILEGLATMPRFEHILGQKQINDLLKYLHTLAKPEWRQRYPNLAAIREEIEQETGDGF